MPVALNTSFNHREPIVETPAHALATLQACDLDAACIGEYLLERSCPLFAQLAERSKDHLVGGREVRQVEKYFLTRISAADVEPANATQPDNIREHHWWTLAELRATPETVYPLGLADLVIGVLENGASMRPVVLNG